MRLLFLVPSIAHKVTAGSRIRYDRLAIDGGLFTVAVRALEEITAEDLASCDVCILSKTYSLEAIAIAGQVKAMGKSVGVDLFDDYFTQIQDSRLLRFRRWLRLAAMNVDFAVCSTRVMMRIVTHYAPDLPVHLLPDPYPEIDPHALGQVLSEKLARAQRNRAIEVLWFGIGSNPNFPVGLHDLVAFSSSLRELASSGFKPRLTILTNKPALKPQQLARLSRLPLDYRIDIWSLEAEKKALAEAFVSFVPVNGQSFSRAKSLNRALTAISSGAQVLSPGFPLYADLHPAIYTHAAELVADTEKGRCRIRKDNIADIGKIVAETSAVGSLANDLFQFLSRCVDQGSWRKAADAPGKRALIYGASQDLLAIKGLKPAGVLSVRSPFARIERAYDIRVDYESGRRLDIWVTPQMRQFLAPDLARKCSAPERRGKVMMSKVEAGDVALLEKAHLISPGDMRAIVQETEAYRAFLQEIQLACSRLFPGISFSLSDINAHASPVPATSTTAGLP